MRFLLLLALVALLSCGKKSLDPTSGGPIRLRSERTEAGQFRQEYTYDDRGNIRLQKSFALPRQSPDSISYTYGPGQRLERIDVSTRRHLSCSTCGGPGLKSTQTFEYDAQGRAIFINLNEQNRLASRTQLVYDSGRIVRINLFGSSNQLFSYQTWQYDSRGNIRQEEGFNPDGTIRYRRNYQYDDRPNPYQYLYLGTYAPLFRSPNNIVREKFEYLGPLPSLGVPDPSYDWKPLATYRYDPLTGYPTRIEAAGVVSILTY